MTGLMNESTDLHSTIANIAGRIESSKIIYTNACTDVKLSTNNRAEEMDSDSGIMTHANVHSVDTNTAGMTSTSSAQSDYIKVLKLIIILNKNKCMCMGQETTSLVLIDTNLLFL